MDEGRIIMQKTAAELMGQNLEEIYMQYMGGHVDMPAAEVA
jgi:hypothetical protein